MQQLEERITDLKSKLEKAKNDLYRAELKLENLEAEEKLILEECKKLGVDPTTLPDEINRLETEIMEDMAKAEELLNVDDK